LLRASPGEAARILSTSARIKAFSAAASGTEKRSRGEGKSGSTERRTGPVMPSPSADRGRLSTTLP
jgi:hypothetical protein